MLELKKIYYNDDFEIVDGNKDYYIYFERVGHRFSRRVCDLVHPEEKTAFRKFLEEKDGAINIFRFEKYDGEYRYNAVKISTEELHGETSKCLHLVDVFSIFDFMKLAEVEQNKIRTCLSILDDVFFYYEKDTNIFRMIHYHDGKSYTDFSQDIDTWCSQMLEEKYVSEKSVADFKKMVGDIKTCCSRLYVSLKGAFRTQGKIHENLNFIGSRFEDGGKLAIVGKVIPDSKYSSTQKTNDLIEELRFDSLTKCYNKKAITDLAMKKFNGTDSGERSALVIVDLDHFKPVNDAYGHLAGDKVLEEAGELLRNIIGNSGSVGRYGGDEFVVILNDVPDEVSLRGVLQTILVNVRNKFQNTFDDIKITSSMGAAVYPDDGNTFDLLFKKADFCLYRAKDKGRNRYVFYRADLHEPLFLKSIESTSGVKYQGRDVLELKYMSEFMQELSTAPYKAIREVLEHMRETYNLNDITIYYGEDLNRIYVCGDAKSEKTADAKYVNLPEFKKALGNKKYIRMDFPEDLSSTPSLKKIFEERGIKTTVNCILGSADDIKGLVTFNRTKESSQWAEYEVNCALMFASSFNLLPESVKIDFALFSKLKS